MAQHINRETFVSKASVITKDHYDGVQESDLDDFRRYAASAVTGRELTAEDLEAISRLRADGRHTVFKEDPNRRSLGYSFGYSNLGKMVSFEYFGLQRPSPLQVSISYREGMRDFQVTLTRPRNQVQQIPAPLNQVQG